MRTWTQMLGDVARGANAARDLPFEEAEALFAAWLADELPALEQGALWTAYRIKGESTDELLGFVAALEASAPALPRPGSAALPVLLPAYNGARRAANLLPLLALVLARAGAPVLLHGSYGGISDPAAARLTDHSPAGRLSAGTILTALGHAPSESRGDISEQLESRGLAYAPIDALYPGLARMLALRQRLGVRSSAHTVAKLFNPFAGPALQVAAVTHPPYLNRLKAVFEASRRNALLFRGTEGEPVAHPQRRPALIAVRAGRAELLFDKDSAPLKALSALPADASLGATCRFTEAVLAGRLPLPVPLADQAAAILCLSGRASSPQAAYSLLPAAPVAQGVS
ncbi:DNA-binding protein YbiB [Thermithiobacillus tepidarius DSM 3134]|uniref:DNA-binding protein YbiB n=1 Tax=Thermithiobacillus tepidarius TaxID=929 RepID=UPI00048C47CA|nr:DNA-binding protein YbiB [Thermithiobacillus tepidarius]